MIRVNLLPFRAARKSDNVKRQVIVFIASIIGFVLLCILYSGMLMNQVATLEDELSIAEADLVRFKKQAAEVDSIMAEIAILEKREATIEGLRGARFESVKIMDYMTQLIVPPSSGIMSKQEQRLWITRLATREENLQLTIDIRGVAVDNKDVAAFLNRLENHTEAAAGPTLAMGGEHVKEAPPYFSEVRLLRLAASTDAELLNFKEFNIVCLRPEPESAESKETKKK